MTSIQADIVSWASGRPGWQQTALCQLAAGNQYDDSELVALAEAIRSGSASSGEVLAEADIPTATSATPTVSLGTVRDTENVNALIGAQELSFAPAGLTVVYGDNGSGKSGYARLIKSAVHSLHSEPVHVNVFGKEPNAPQKAEISYLVGGQAQSSSWPSPSGAELTEISFYDEACGDVYLEVDSELGYRPSSLVLLDQLIALCDRLKLRFEQQLTQNEAAFKGLPRPSEGSPAGAFLATLSGATTSTTVDAALALGPGAAVELGELIQEEARLRLSDPAKERARLTEAAAKITSLAVHIGRLADKLDDEALAGALAQRDSGAAAKEAARIASASTFDSEPLSGVGTDSWRLLWQAARRYSEENAYPGREFPVTDDAHCLLCQQPLASEGADRLRRFDAFVSDETARQAEVAEAALKATTDSLEGLVSQPAALFDQYSALEGSDPGLADEVKAWMEEAEARRLALLAALKEDSPSDVSALPASPRAALDELAKGLSAEAATIDEAEFKTRFDEVVAEKEDLEGRQLLAAGRADIDAEIRRLGERDELSAAKKAVDTKAITRKSTELSEQYVTSEVRDRFIRESDRLLLERIQLKQTGGQKGRVRQRPALLGAQVSKPVHEVLSEGEKTALGLAGYFTEAHFDSSKSALVLDDPVSSLDHIRRDAVASRLAQLGGERQVIVFTHDLEFVVSLSAAASREGVEFTERSIQRSGDKTPGICVDEHPWKAKDVNRRLGDLEVRLAEIERERSNWTQDEYESACIDWAGKLSEAWERLLHLEVAQPIFDLAKSEVHPQGLKVIAQITPEQNKQFQESYGRASGWLRRHDKSPGKNTVAPEPNELRSELEAIRAFHKSVKDYKNS